LHTREIHLMPNATTHTDRDTLEEMAETAACEWLGKWDEY
jgi:hypothetical protein